MVYVVVCPVFNFVYDNYFQSKFFYALIYKTLLDVSSVQYEDCFPSKRIFFIVLVCIAIIGLCGKKSTRNSKHYHTAIILRSNNAKLCIGVDSIEFARVGKYNERFWRVLHSKCAYIVYFDIGSIIG